MGILTKVEVGTFLKLFNRGGYVLDFSTNDFDVFTMGSIGVALCDKYKMSKGKSLSAYVNEASEEDVIKLLKDLLDYYEENYEKEYTQETDEETYGYFGYNAEYARLYNKSDKLKFNFKIQQYQTDAVDAVVKVFNGQGFYDKISYIRDLGKMKSKDMQMTLGFTDEEMQLYDPTNDTGYKNELVELSDEQLLSNIQALQRQNNIKLSNSLVKDMGRCSLDIEMETGTGKTYVYIKTMFELNKKYGWSKFIVVVPSIAIREGVKKSFEITADHFMEHYGKKARFFIYNSSNLNQLDNFSSSSGINVMIINTQAFASSLKEDGRSKEARIIYSKRDEFGSD